MDTSQKTSNVIDAVSNLAGLLHEVWTDYILYIDDREFPIRKISNKELGEYLAIRKNYKCDMDFFDEWLYPLCSRYIGTSFRDSDFDDDGNIDWSISAIYHFLVVVESGKISDLGFVLFEFDYRDGTLLYHGLDGEINNLKEVDNLILDIVGDSPNCDDIDDLFLDLSRLGVPVNR